MRNFWYLIIGGIIVCGSCAENTAGLRYPESNHYLSCLLREGFFVEGEQAVKAGKTQDIANAEWDLLADSLAQVKLQEFASETAEPAEITLSWDSSQRAYLDAGRVMRIKAGYRYRLEVTMADGSQLSAETLVPEKIAVYADSLVAEERAWDFDEEPEEWRELVLDEADSQHPVQIGTQNDNEFNLYTEFWCLEEYQDAEYTYPEDDKLFPSDEAEYMGDSQQYPRRQIGFYMYQPENGIVNFNCYQGSLRFYGRMRLKVYAIDTNFLKYLYRADGYEEGGIKGGIGFFGSCSGRDLYSRIVKRVNTDVNNIVNCNGDAVKTKGA